MFLRSGLRCSVAARGVRFYQLPAKTGRNIINVYPVVEQVNRSSVVDRLAKADLDSFLDVDGWRRKLLVSGAKGVQTGDIVRVSYDKSKTDQDVFVGYVLSVDRKRLPQDTSLLLRNQINKTFVELRVPVFSPLLERIDIIQKNNGKRQRSKHYYIRGTRLDVGNLDNMLLKKK